MARQKKQYDRCWHFVRSNEKGEMVLRDGRTVEAGKWLTHRGKATICENGLHASRRAIDALDHLHWDNGFVCLVEVDKIEADQGNKIMCRRRRIVRAVKCDELLREFARSCALDVIHLWDAPQVVIDYLKTGREELRVAAGAAAWDAARAAARVAAGAAAGAAAWDAARAAAWDAARAAAGVAAGAAAWAAAGVAAGDAAWDAARAAAWDAARAAAGAAQNKKLESLFLAAMEAGNGNAG